MKEDKFLIKLNKIETLYQFICDARSVNNTITASQGLYTVDAKLLSSLFTLDLTKTIEITIYGDISLGDLYMLRKYIGE